MRAQITVLVIDPDPSSGERLAQLVAPMDVGVRQATNRRGALSELAEHEFSLVVLELALPDTDGMELLHELGRRYGEIPVVVTTPASQSGDGVRAVREGASDFLCRPYEEEEVLYVFQKTIQSLQLISEPPKSAILRERSAIIGSSPVMSELERTLQRVADGVATVLIRGESGTGKELVARRIHEQSPRSAGPFIKVHCGALPDNLLESELFGYERGAFTGATQRKPGRVELADGGTLFLDEIGDITLAMQVKLLRVLQEREYERLGGTQTLKADVRFVAATHRDLDAMVRSGDYREDLFYRLSVVPLQVPPLRARPDDIAELAVHFARTAGLANGRGAMGIDPQALELLRRHRWPGNVRQLQNFIERLVLLADGPRITARDAQVWQPAVEGSAPPPPVALDEAEVATEVAATEEDDEVLSLALTLARAEKRALLRALKKAGGNRAAAAKLLGVSRRTLYYKLNEHGVS